MVTITGGMILGVVLFFYGLVAFGYHAYHGDWASAFNAVWFVALGVALFLVQRNQQKLSDANSKMMQTLHNAQGEMDDLQVRLSKAVREASSLRDENSDLRQQNNVLRTTARQQAGSQLREPTPTRSAHSAPTPQPRGASRTSMARPNPSSSPSFASPSPIHHHHDNSGDMLTGVMIGSMLSDSPAPTRSEPSCEPSRSDTDYGGSSDRDSGGGYDSGGDSGGGSCD